MIYYGVVEKDADSAFGVTFPDLPGCISAADEEADVVSEAQVALSLYAEGEDELPAPRALEDLRRDPDIKRALAGGAFLIAVPLAFSERKVRTNVMIDRGLLEVVDRQARAIGVTRSEYLSRAAEGQLNRDGGVWVKRNASNGARSPAKVSKQRSSMKKA